MTVKAQLKAIFDNLDLSYVTARNGRTGFDKVILRKRAKEGGSMGPMTVTNAHLDRCVTTQDKLANKLREELSKQFGTYSMVFKPCYVGSSDMLNLVIHIPLSDKLTRVITFKWQTFAQYVNSSYDPSYETYWYVMETEDKKTADIQ
jgi:hypothetical protein